VRENRTVQAKELENQQLRTVQSQLQKQVIDLQHQQSQDNNELRQIQEHETAIREERHSKAIKVIQDAQAQELDLLNKDQARAMQRRQAARIRELQRHDELHEMDVSRLNTEHASKVQIQLRENESLKSGHAAKIEAIRSDCVASW
jgi:hypothetical protein